MKKACSVLLALVMLAAAIAVSVPASADRIFSDVEEDRWSEASVRYAVNSGYMKGVGAGKFDPEGFLTRAMVATVLWRREGSPEPGAPGCPHALALQHDLALAVGPEGGYTPEEVGAFRSHGFECVSLGSFILRVEFALSVLCGKLIP